MNICLPALRLSTFEVFEAALEDVESLNKCTLSSAEWKDILRAVVGANLQSAAEIALSHVDEADRKYAFYTCVFCCAARGYHQLLEWTLVQMSATLDVVYYKS